MWLVTFSIEAKVGKAGLGTFESGVCAHQQIKLTFPIVSPGFGNKISSKVLLYDHNLVL